MSAGLPSPACPGLPTVLVVDRLAARGLAVFGPDRAAAELEGSKVFAKGLFARHGIPTARFDAFEDAARAHEELHRLRAEDVALRSAKDLVAYDVEALRAREQELGARLADRTREVEALQQARAAEAAKVEQAAVETDRLRQTIAQLEMERGRLAAEVGGAACATPVTSSSSGNEPSCWLSSGPSTRSSPSASSESRSASGSMSSWCSWRLKC